MLQAMEREDEWKMIDVFYRFQLALVSHGNLKNEAFGEIQEAAIATYKDLFHSLRPWDVKRAKEQEEEELNNLFDRYKKEIGDPADPVWRAKVERDLVKLYHELGQQKQEETPEQKVERRARELAAEARQKRLKRRQARSL